MASETLLSAQEPSKVQLTHERHQGQRISDCGQRQSLAIFGVSAKKASR